MTVKLKSKKRIAESDSRGHFCQRCGKDITEKSVISHENSIIFHKKFVDENFVYETIDF